MSNDQTRDTSARDSFLTRVREMGHEVEPDEVIARDNVYRIDGQVHLLVRTSRFHQARRTYFFGLTRHIFENFAQLPHPVIAFVFSDTLETLLIPARWMWDQREKLNASVKQFKLPVDRSCRLQVLKEAGQPLDLGAFRDRYDILTTSAPITSVKHGSKAELNKHSELQGMLLEIGNVRGAQTYCANKSPRFKGKRLGEIATVKQLPEFPGINYDMVRQIDVIWLEKSFPVHAFEVELTTGIWSGLVRLGEFRRLNTVVHVVTESDEKAFKRRVAGDIFAEIIDRCHHANAIDIRELYETDTRAYGLRTKLYL
ncbi:MAG: hypothetical protein ABIP48_28145 [Planctomycetota bacterium]